MKKIFLLLALLCSSCSFFQGDQSRESKKPLVIVSNAPYVKVVKQIANNEVEIRTIIPADVDPHNYEPSPRDMAPLMHASLWIQVGEEFEGLLQNRLKETTPDLIVLPLQDVTKTIPSSCHHHHHKHHHHHGECRQDIDTHYWLDPLTVAEQAKYITNDLIKLLPEKKELFENNLEKLTRLLYSLNTEIARKLKPFRGNVILSTHAAYGYFCKQYGLIQIGIESEDGKETRTQEIHHVLQSAIKHKNQLIGILLQPQHVNRAAETLGSKLSLPLFMVNPYEENYITTMKKLANIVLRYGKKSN